MPNPTLPPSEKARCSVVGCHRNYTAKTFCMMHYKRNRRYGDPLVCSDKHKPLAIQTRFWTRVEKTETCWNWVGPINKGKYGTIQENGKTYLVHRIAYQQLVGEVPTGLVLDHLCRNTKCVNPQHLEPVTQSENVRRGFGVGALNSKKTHCWRGHPFTPENTYSYTCKNKYGTYQQRVCKTCKKQIHHRKNNT